MQSSYDLVADEFSAVDQLIHRQLVSDVGLVEDISQHLVTGGGKRIRPLVTLLLSGALGDSNSARHIKLATAIEFLHTATLLHDDVVDMSSLRRGRPTANANWGNASSVLVGDFVYSKAFQLMVAIGELEVMEIISAATTKIAEGEVKQLAAIGNLSLTRDDYFTIIERKTAQLFEAACQSCAAISSTGQTTAERLGQFGRQLGLAFQLIDDYLDYAGNDADLGKHVGDDLNEGKLTLPLIDALATTREQAPTQHRQLSDIIQQKDLSQIATVIEITSGCGALDRTREAAQQCIAEAKAQLTSLPDSTHKTALFTVSDFVLARSQ